MKYVDTFNSIVTLAGLSVAIVNGQRLSDMITHVPGELAARRAAGLNAIGQVRKSRTWRYRDPRIDDYMRDSMSALDDQFGRDF